jgi:hypothetical protein
VVQTGFLSKTAIFNCNSFNGIAPKKIGTNLKKVKLSTFLKCSEAFLKTYADPLSLNS